MLPVAPACLTARRPHCLPQLASPRLNNPAPFFSPRPTGQHALLRRERSLRLCCGAHPDCVESDKSFKLCGGVGSASATPALCSHAVCRGAADAVGAFDCPAALLLAPL